MTPPITDIVAEMRAGLEGVTPGPWRGHSHFLGSGVETANGDPVAAAVMAGRFVDMVHIARCDPDTIRALLDDWEARGAEIERLTMINSASSCQKLTTNCADTDAAQERESAWLIERGGTYATGSGQMVNWSSDPWRAQRYSNFASAERGRLLLATTELRDSARSIEHMFINRTPSPAAEAVKEALEAIAGEHASEMAREEKAHLQTIDERDSAQECISDIYFMMTGRSPEWSNHFGLNDCLDELREARQLLGDSIKDLQAALTASAQREDVMRGALEGARQGFRAMSYMTNPQVIREKSGEEAKLISDVLDHDLARAALAQTKGEAHAD